MQRVSKHVVPLVAVLLGCTYIYLPLRCLAEETGLVDASTSTDMTTATIKMFGSLLLIVGVILCVFYLLKKLRVKGLALGKTNYMEIVSTLNVAPRRAITLVEICGEWLVLGVGADSVTLIEKIDRERMEAYKQLDKTHQVSGFHALLRKHTSTRSGVEKGDD